MRVEVKVEDCDIRSDKGRMTPGVCVTCTRCDEQAEAYGQGEASITAAIMKLKDDCPNDENNFYVAEE